MCFNVLLDASTKNMKKPHIILIGNYNLFEAPPKISTKGTETFRKLFLHKVEFEGEKIMLKMVKFFKPN